MPMRSRRDAARVAIVVPSLLEQRCDHGSELGARGRQREGEGEGEGGRRQGENEKEKEINKIEGRREAAQRLIWQPHKP